MCIAINPKLGSHKTGFLPIAMDILHSLFSISKCFLSLEVSMARLPVTEVASPILFFIIPRSAPSHYWAVLQICIFGTEPFAALCAVAPQQNMPLSGNRDNTKFLMKMFVSMQYISRSVLKALL